MSYRHYSSYRRGPSRGPSPWALLGLFLALATPAVIIALLVAGVIR